MEKINIDELELGIAQETTGGMSYKTYHGSDQAIETIAKKLNELIDLINEDEQTKLGKRI